MIRIANNQDSSGIIALVDQVYTEYGERICLDGADSDLLDVQGSYIDRGGCIWVLELDGQIAGSHAALPLNSEKNVCGFRRLYLVPELRGGDWGHQLMQITIDWARERGFAEVQFWSDVRFKRAHRFFTKFGFQADGRTREMHDGHDPYTEYFFSLKL